MNNTYEIYQLKHDDELRYHRFESLDRLHKFGLEVDKDNYELVYSADNNENMALEDIFEKFNVNRPDDFKGHSLSVSDIVVLKSDGEEKAYYCDSFGFTEIPYFLQEQKLETEVAVEIADRLISIQECDDGYDYTIYGMDYREIDGGVYDNPDITIREALKDIIDDLRESHYDASRDIFYRTLAQGDIMTDSVVKDIDYDDLIEKAEQTASEQIKEAYKPNAVEIFKQKTQEYFHPINDMTIEDIETTAYAYVQAILDDVCPGAKVLDVALSGSRCRGLEQDNSDIDVVVEYEGDIKEDVLFNYVHDENFSLCGLNLDINPITESKTGTLETYLPTVEKYLTEKVKQQNMEITLYVSECNEFPTLGEYHDKIETVEEALMIYDSIPPERMHGIRSIGMNIHEKGKDIDEDDQIDLLVGNKINMYLLSYIPYVTDIDKAVDTMAELIYQSNMEIDGVIPNVVVARLEEIKEERMNPVEKLARDIDRFSKEYDPHDYADRVDDSIENQTSIKETIEVGETGYLKDWLDTITVEDDYIDNRRHAHQLLHRLEQVAKIQEYKPLAKVEELEEGNYDKIDGLIDTSEKNNKVEKEKKEKGISIRNKIAEKKIEIERKQRQKECAPPKKDQAPSRE